MKEPDETLKGNVWSGSLASCFGAQAPADGICSLWVYGLCRPPIPPLAVVEDADHPSGLVTRMESA